MAPNAVDYIAIQNTISRYCIALDTKNFDLLKQVFTEDVDTVYPFGGQRKGVQPIIDAISKRLSPVTHQHALTTQHIEIAADGKSAESTTYFTGIHFGKGKWDGKEVTAWGKYDDRLTLIEGKQSLPGASGQWFISRREVSFFGRLGEEGVMDGE
ncbi:hypothetical protein LTR78_001634 [Recurvomyces mirabilis]|uniref:SnoaL-like domain-containing protein n=1 Tax=Recurvomyces mirabilis TaxID=574656 RepID=A0AAE0WUT8_9PEZI|nr:hypothetical protein LTR78_001634 [Recurvomyces mirabilis]KAK5151796.1 hypothetical protein LTS14_008928 [Recurvomyces mirabilis]